MTATVYLRQLVGPLDTLMLWIEQLQGAGASYARVEGLADTRRRSPIRRANGPEVGDRIRVNNAHYSYTGARDDFTASICWCSPENGWPSSEPPEQESQHSRVFSPASTALTPVR